MSKDNLYTLVGGMVFLFVAISALGAGESRYGVLMSFVAMLMWAAGAKECDELRDLCRKGVEAGRPQHSGFEGP